MSDNPYQTPKADIQIPLLTNDTFIPASATKRFLNYLIDTLVAGFGLGFALGFAIGWVWGDEGLSFLEQFPDIVYGTVVSILYYLPFELACGRTLGKLITGTKVVDEEGRKPGAGRIVGRTLCRFIPFEVFSFLGRETRGWHDSISKTWVICTR